MDFAVKDGGGVYRAPYCRLNLPYSLFITPYGDPAALRLANYCTYVVQYSTVFGSERQGRGRKGVITSWCGKQLMLIRG
jgi:hypothetical protein